LQAFEEILRRQPLNIQARYNLAMAHARMGQAGTAAEIMEQGQSSSPGNGDAYEALASVREFIGRPEAALHALLAGTDYAPERMTLWEHAIHLMQQLGRFDQAVALSTKLTSLFPDGAYAWYLHAVALSQGPTGNDFVAIEKTLRHSLSLNAILWRSAYRLSNLLMHQNRFEEAKAVVEQQMPSFEDASYHKAQLARILWMQGRRKDAIDAMVAMLAIWPKTSWGWTELLDWLDQQEDWATVRKVLDDVPPVMVSNADFRARRLMVLKKAGWDNTQLNESWQALLGDFPAHEDIHLSRFDMLWADRHFEDAQQVLEQVRRLYPNSEFVAARMVHIAARQNTEEALRLAMTIWTNLQELSTWPAAYAWEAIGPSNIADKAVKQLYEWLMQGKPIRPSAMGGLLKYIHKGQFKRVFWDFLCGGLNSTSRDQARIRALKNLLNILEDHRWDEGYCRAQVLVALAKTSRQQAWNYFRRHKSCQEQTPVWAEGCRMFLPASRKWLAQWREHKDVEMYAVANYTLAIRTGNRKSTRLSNRDLQEMADSAQQALTTLVYDTTPKYLACTLCETQLRLRRHDAFLASMEQYRSLILSKDKRFWMEGYANLPRLLWHFDQLLKSTSPKEAQAATTAFVKDGGAYPAWARPLWRSLLWKRVGFWRWLAYAARLA